MFERFWWGRKNLRRQVCSGAPAFSYTGHVRNSLRYETYKIKFLKTRVFRKSSALLDPRPRGFSNSSSWSPRSEPRGLIWGPLLSKAQNPNIGISDYPIFGFWRNFYVIGNGGKAESYYPIFAFQPSSYVIEPPHSSAHWMLCTVQHTLHYALHARSAATILLNQNQSMSSVLQKIISLAESEASSDSKKAVKRTRDTDDYIFQSSLGKLIRPCRDDKYFRTRWREGYCRDLAEKENSFIAEYRLDPVSFDLLSEMLAPDLGVNEVMANLSSKSGLITNHSRLGCALIMLAGGRNFEAMRSHRVSQSFTY